MRITIRRLATGSLLTAALASCDSTALESTGGDRVNPAVTVSSQAVETGDTGQPQVNIRTPIDVKVVASDNASIAAVVTRILADGQQVQRDSLAVNSASNSVTRNNNFTLVGVRAGQQLAIVAEVIDAGGNVAGDTIYAVAWDPSVPLVSLLNPDNAVIQGGTYTFRVHAIDSLGLSKIGYRAQGLPSPRSDSTRFSAPLPKNDTIVFSLQVPSNAAVGSTFTVEGFAENRDGLRALASSVTVTVSALGADATAPIVQQSIPPRAEFNDTLEFAARDSDGLVRIVGFIARDSAGAEVFRAADTLGTPAQQVVRRKAFQPPLSARGRGVFITGYAIDVSGKTGYAVPGAATLPVTDPATAVRDPIVFAFGRTSALPVGSLGADIAVDEARSRVYVSNINRNQLEAWTYGPTLTAMSPVSVGAQPWGMTIDNSGSLLLVANSGGTNISKVNLLNRQEEGRIKTANEYLYSVRYSKDENSGGYKYQVVGPIDYSDRPQYIAQSASGALYYSTRPTSEATPGTLRRIDNFLDARTEPRQIWQYGALARGEWAIINADFVDVDPGANGVPDEIIICDHKPGDSPSTATCVQGLYIPDVVAQLRASPVNGNVDQVKDLSIASLALPDTNFVAVGGDRRRVAFGEANTGRAGRVLMVFDPSGTPQYSEQYNAPIEVRDLTNNASEKVFGLAINKNSSNVSVHGVETFFADSSLRLQGKFATFNTGAGVAFHPDNADDFPTDDTQRVVFVASGDMSIQIVDSYTYRLRGRIPLRTNLYGALRAAYPTAAERAADPSLVVKLFGLTAEGLVMIDVRKSDIDNSRQ
jgi:hypothetical protein